MLSSHMLSLVDKFMKQFHNKDNNGHDSHTLIIAITSLAGDTSVR